MPFVSPNPCSGARLAIEIDGDTHAAPDQAAYDSARTAWLGERGYKVIRFHASEAERDLAGVLEAIRRACEARTPGGREEGERPSPYPLPEGERDMRATALLGTARGLRNPLCSRPLGEQPTRLRI